MNTANLTGTLIVLASLVVLPVSFAADFIFAEGEKFLPLDDKGWQVTHQNESWASHTYGGAWTSHGGLLGAPADSVDSVAVQAITIPVAGDYRVWSRYQAPPYFNFSHRVEVHQDGEILYSYVYGRKESMRQWSFGAVSDQLWWSWGVDHDAAEAPSDKVVKLQAGPAKVRLVTVEMGESAGDPMVDLIVLTNDLADSAIGHPGTLFTTQAMAASELYLRFRNTTDAPARLKLRRPTGHYQPLQYAGDSTVIPETDVPAGEWSDWMNIAPFCMLVHDDGIHVSLAGAAGFPVQVARDRAGKDLAGDMQIAGATGVIVIPVDITWNRARHVQTRREHTARVIALAKTKWRTANGGRKPQELLYLGWVADPEMKDALGYNTLLPDQYDHNPIDGYFQHAGNEDQIRKLADRLSDKDKASQRVVSYGDETHVEFESAQTLTRLTRELIGPQVETGVNYSPHYPLPQYYGAQKQWVDIFKAAPDALTMFWTEDYLFSVPQLPQTFSWTYAQIHCGIKYHKQKIHMYVMPHAPGQVASVFRRNMVLSIGAGARHIDSFCVAPAGVHTENYVSWGYTDTFRVLHESIYDSAEAEPYQINGKLRPGRVAIVLSRATETNEAKLTFDPATDPFMNQCKNAAGEQTYNRQTLCRKDQQMLYLALRHAQYKVDLITEDDIMDGYLKGYDVVHFAGEWIDTRVVPKLAQWVKAGGILYATSGIGHLDQDGEKCPAMLKLLGLQDSSLTKNIRIMRPFLEMPLVEPIDSITLAGADSALPAIAMRQVLVPAGAEVRGTWSDGSPAVTMRTLGKGRAIAVGTLAGSSYMRSGLRPVPFARGGNKMLYNPTEFSAAAVQLVGLGVAQADIKRHAECSNNFVETLVMDSDKGTLVTLVNWDNMELPGLQVRVRLPAAPTAVRSVQQQQELEGWEFNDGILSFTTDLEWADYILVAK
jgi:hypothetical protein